ncbi:lipid storage droplets surface-binding protein 2-like [Ctenocephalides felis]|uniref:lipid storage droplets surface-binding protein 2-like n=1 Tax=Ctenocephalides felis TaxID=7515 RepID=UPI000E6E295A|nr:lipid storage droplets surface-binding protein 2-like [Ctenocephalides felis]XP_026473934.1 lipid storage droplets surface-binding protein 2-like [Ctenocephalides felis]
MSATDTSATASNNQSIIQRQINQGIERQIIKAQRIHQIRVPHTPQLPQMQIIDRIMQVPVIESAVKKSQNVYDKIKSISPIMASTLDTAENVTRRIAVPLAHHLGRPLNALDNTLMASLDKIQNTIPVVRDTPSDIIRRTEHAISAIKSISVQKTNEALATTNGVRALNTLDAATNRAISLIDHYLPACKSESGDMQLTSAIDSDIPVKGIDRAVIAVGKVGRTVTGRLHGKAQRAIPAAICNLGLAGPLESLNDKVKDMKKKEIKKSDKTLQPPKDANAVSQN